MNTYAPTTVAHAARPPSGYVCSISPSCLEGSSATSASEAWSSLDTFSRLFFSSIPLFDVEDRVACFLVAGVEGELVICVAENADCARTMAYLNLLSKSPSILRCFYKRRGHVRNHAKTHTRERCSIILDRSMVKIRDKKTRRTNHFGFILAIDNTYV